jgi:hypothetical protein
MEISLNIRADKLLEAFGKAPQAVRDHLRIAVKSSTVDVQRVARKSHRFATKSGVLERAVTVEFPGEMTGRVFLNPAIAGYAGAIHDGSRPHRIDPKRKKLLRWAAPLGGGGKGFAFARHVNHPGTKPDPFLYTALEARRDSIQEKMDKATDAALREAGL